MIQRFRGPARIHRGEFTVESRVDMDVSQPQVPRLRYATTLVHGWHERQAVLQKSHETRRVKQTRCEYRSLREENIMPPHTVAVSPCHMICVRCGAAPTP